MSKIYINPFSYRNCDGAYYTVEAEVDYIPPIVSEKHLADCPTDLTGEFDVLDCRVFDSQGKDVTAVVYVPDSVLLRELEIQQEFEIIGGDYEGH